MRTSTASDVSTLAELNRQVGGKSGPLGVVGVLSRADEIGVGRIDAMMSAKDIAEGPGGPLSQRLNGTGPFRFVEQRGNDTVLEAFDGYFKGKPSIPSINFTFVGDSTTRMLSLMNVVSCTRQ